MSGLPVVSLSGLNADSLGNYLASLGLFSLATRNWPNVRAVWRNARFCLVGGPAKLEQIVEFVSGIGESSSWTRYERSWDAVKKADVARKTSIQTALWRAFEAEERCLRSFGAHLALDGRVRMNPLLGTGGNAGKRDFASGWRKAVRNIEKPPRGQSRGSLENDLKAFLSGDACAFLDSFQGGLWFGADTKIFNHGTKRPSRKGEITPWAMALACEGLPFFAGGVSRQLGSRRQPKGAFPFVTLAMAPLGAGEAGIVEAEVWAPIWDRPMTEPELRSLFLRGRAELGGKGAASPVTFAVGVTSRGVDAGISEFRRFLLLHTTSAHTFESRLATVIPVPKTNQDKAAAWAVRTIVEFHQTLPKDRKVGQRWRFSGLRGPLEQALVNFSAAVRSASHTEQAWALVDEMFAALVKVDRNQAFRAQNVKFQLLPGEWAAKLFRKDPPDQEARLARAISSLLGTTFYPPLIAYRIGVRNGLRDAYWSFPKAPPMRRIWNYSGLAENFCAVAERRTMEALQKAEKRPPFGASIRVALDDVQSWLSEEVDEERLRLWLDRLCVFDWKGETNGNAGEELRRDFPGDRTTVDGALALYALFRPFASDWLFRQIVHESATRAEIIPTCASLGRIIAMLRQGYVEGAAEVAFAAYRSAGVALADFSMFPDGPDTDRLLSALVIPARDEQTLAVFRRWLAPTKPNEQ